ncbi:MAG TPA: isocitrate/isopropylmalate family dehydrogenase, partial [Sphingomonadales bacterium]
MKSILLLPGDGIGPEVMGEVRRVLDWLAANRGFRFELHEALVGGCSYDAHGVPVTDEVVERAR